jgi:hypothetical protein
MRASRGIAQGWHPGATLAMRGAVLVAARTFGTAWAR